MEAVFKASGECGAGTYAETEGLTQLPDGTLAQNHRRTVMLISHLTDIHHESSCLGILLGNRFTEKVNKDHVLKATVIIIKSNYSLTQDQCAFIAISENILSKILTSALGEILPRCQENGEASHKVL